MVSSKEYLRTEWAVSSNTTLWATIQQIPRILADLLDGYGMTCSQKTKVRGESTQGFRPMTIRGKHVQPRLLTGLIFRPVSWKYGKFHAGMNTLTNSQKLVTGLRISVLELSSPVAVAMERAPPNPKPNLLWSTA